MKHASYSILTEIGQKTTNSNSVPLKNLLKCMSEFSTFWIFVEIRARAWQVQTESYLLRNQNKTKRRARYFQKRTDYKSVISFKIRISFEK